MKRLPVMLACLAGLMLTSAQLSAQETREPAPAKETKPAPKAEEVRKIGIGDAAPAMNVSRWVKGEPVTGFEKGRVYVVEFWATWCPPCRESIPHLTELAAKHKGKVTIIGVSVWESDQAKVEPFVTEWGDKMNYTVAMDVVPAYPEKVKAGTGAARNWAVQNGAMSKSWMTAADQNGIPAAFIVNGEGKIAWIGFPLSDEFPTVLQSVLDGKHDIAAAKAKAMQEKAAEEAMETFQQLLLGKKDYAAAYAHASKVIDGDLKDNAQALNAIAWTTVDAKGVKERNLDVAMKAAVRACELTKYKDAMILDTLARVHWEKGDKAKAVEFQAKAVEAGSPNKEMMDDIKKTLEKYKTADAPKPAAAPATEKK